MTDQSVVDGGRFAMDGVTPQSQSQSPHRPLASPVRHHPQTKKQQQQQQQHHHQYTSMVQSMRDHAAHDRATLAQFQTLQDSVVSRMLRSQVRYLCLVCIVGVLVVLYFQPRPLMDLVGSLYSYVSTPPLPLIVLPGRTIVTLYPPHVHVGQSLPRFFSSYAIATLDNAPARAAVQTVAAQREIVTQPQRQRRHATTNKQHHQPIQFHTWEHDEFYHHMVVRQPQGAMDHVCGTSRMRRDATTNDKKSSTTSSSSLVGYQELYESFLLEDSIPPFGTKNPSFAARTNSSSSSSWADDLMISCLLRTGNADGYVKPTVHVFSPIVRGRHGVAAQYYNHSTEEAENDPQQQQQQNHHDHTTTTTTKGRIHSDLLLLPILSFEELALPTAQRVASTELPKRMTEFLQSTLSTHWNRRHHNNNDDDDDNPLNSLDDASINRQWEEFLYHAIVEQEGTRGTWAFFMAVCRPEDRVRFLTHGEAHDRHRLIATTCRRRQSENLTRTTPFVADSYHWQSTYDEEDLVSDQQDCCLFFDTTQKSFQKE